MGTSARAPLQGRTVNIKWYLKRDGMLDTAEFTADRNVAAGRAAQAIRSLMGYTGQRHQSVGWAFGEAESR